MAETRTRTIGVAGLFDDPKLLKRAAERVRDERFERWDCHTPYPVHGLDQAMGLRPSPVPVVTLTAGLVGFLAAIALTGGLNALHYPIRIGGKALFSWQAYVPIFFELFVLFAALATMAAVIVFCKLGRWHSPLHDAGIMQEVTCDRFAIVVLTEDEEARKKAVAVLSESQCDDVRALVEREDKDEARL